MARASRKTLARIAGVVAGAAMVAVPLTATSASAAPSGSTGSGHSKVQGMTFYDDYWTLNECKTVGDWGLSHGKWTVYDCQESPWDFDLYVDS
ncbi:hypothetical protein [Streptomyces sp. NPDC059009]|uniref:hypothetical protein n=1 Tax=Streptomyces sp. NPDC059009 TaxID=3346694 RepID=UPI0036A089A8